MFQFAEGSDSEGFQAKVAEVGTEVEFMKDEKGINSANAMDKTMPSGPKKVEATKSDTKEEPYSAEEKDAKVEDTKAEDAPVEVKEAPKVDEKEDDDEFEEALKALSARFDRLEASIAKVLDGIEKANYTSKPPKVTDYPEPLTGGPLSDGKQAPKLSQGLNPNAKPFGKDIQKSALGAAADGSREGPTMGQSNEITEALRQVLTGKAKITQINARRMGRA
jgi:hypothetical protein